MRFIEWKIKSNNTEVYWKVRSELLKWSGLFLMVKETKMIIKNNYKQE